MKTHCFLCLFLFYPLLFSAQVNDAFSDGNFNANPAWTGNDTDFTVNASFQLQLNSSGSDTSYLCTPTTYPLNSCEWNFWIRLNFSPSASNNARVYLVSDQQNLQGPLNGYFLQFGEALSNDQVELFRQTGTTIQSVCRGTTLIASAFAIRVKVQRDNSGLWTLSIDPSGGINYVQEAQGTDATHISTSFFGWNCFYTSSNSANFYLDDVYTGAPIVDLAPPAVDSVAVNVTGQVEIYFSENVDLTSSQNTGNYLISNSVGNPLTAVRDGSNFSLVTLQTNPLPVNTLLTLTTTGVSDLSANPITVAEVDTFYFSFPDYNDIVINEIMADPDPPVALPNYEYVELYNRTSLPFYCRNYSITVGTNMQLLPDFEILPDSFVVLTSTTAASQFPGIHVIGVPSFPSITNTGNTITVKKSSGVPLCTVSYDDSWYRDPNKEDGGYSLEQIDDQMPCTGAINWKASESASGGTPGRRNAVNGITPDNSFPLMLRATVTNPTQLLVYFSEPVDSIGTFSTSPPLPVISPVFYSDDHTVISVTLGSSVQPFTAYLLRLNGYHSDCAGNLIPSEQTVKFGIAEPALPGDLILNELLPDPYEGGAEFVEIYNLSNKILDLSSLQLSGQDTLTNVLEDVHRLSTESFIIFPSEFILLSTGKSQVCSFYNCPPEGIFADLSDMPSLSNDGDVVVLSDTLGTILDKVIYTSDWQFSLLQTTKGVSLERIRYDRPTQDAGNWHSASSAVNGTPGRVNSQFMNEGSSGNMTVNPEIFSPDNDGHEDILEINYQLDKAGFTGSLIIYDQKGRLVRRLVRNQILGTTGAFTWDGTNDGGKKALTGIHIIYFELFHADGEVRTYKKVCVVGSKQN
ncbi:MAG: lamin tail domain-containing protein [Bacteroidia bacterium]|nr:lamin tail domain-containing protein [Bacteroidia bacterium]